MNVRLVIELDVGASPIADAISYFVARYGLTAADDSRSATEWIEAIIIDSVQRSVGDIDAQGGAQWVILSTTVSRSG